MLSERMVGRTRILLKKVDCILQILFSSYLISLSLNHQFQKSEAFQSVHHVSFILCYTVLYDFVGLRCRFGRHRTDVHRTLCFLSGQMVRQDIIQCLRVDGLGQVIVHSGLQRLFLLLFKSIRCHGNDRYRFAISTTHPAFSRISWAT